MKSLSDQEVIDVVLGGDKDAFCVLVERYQQRVYRTLYWMCGNNYDAEEMTQEVFVRAFYALPTHKPQYKFSTWLFQIARNQCINFLKRRDREFRYDSDDSAPTDLLLDTTVTSSPSTSAERSDVSRRLWRAVAELPDEFRDIVVMRHVSELTYREICAVTELPMGTVKSRLARARSRLLEAVSEELEPSPES